MGSRQENWFYRTLSESKDRGAKWRIVGNQLIFSRIFSNDKGAMSKDSWDVRAFLFSVPKK
jgi:alkaline phosphatase D